MNLSEAYQTRALDFLGLWRVGRWRMKTYGIVYGQKPLDEKLVKTARRIAEERLNLSAEETNHYGVGFIGIHQGKTGNFVFIDWWADENELHHHVYVSSLEAPEELRYMTPTGLAACAWDLYLIGHERDAWVNKVLAANGGSDLEGYLACHTAAGLEI